MIPAPWRSFLFSFKGRITRLPFWLWCVAGIPLGMINDFVQTLLEQPPKTGVLFYLAAAFLILWTGIVVVEFWASLAIMTKRLHDRDRSGWFLLIGFIPLIGFLWLFYELGFGRGTDGPNRFGPEPNGATGLSHAAT